MKKEGEKAPEITGIDQFGNQVSTNNFKGKKLLKKSLFSVIDIF